jgi:phosphate-selective porin OprO/OprP
MEVIPASSNSRYDVTRGTGVSKAVRNFASVVAMGTVLGWAAPALAQDAGAVSQELAQMRAQMERMAARIDELESQLAKTSASASAAASAAGEAKSAVAAAQQEPQVGIAWKGGPEFSGDNGWRFKPRGRLQLDAGFIAAPEATGRPDGFGTSMRRARLGFEGDMPGGIGYTFEVDFGVNSIEIVDAYVSYSTGDFEFVVGHHKPFTGIEEMTSDLHTAMMERAAFTDAFSFERRLGASVQYQKGEVLVQGGIFSDDAPRLPNKIWSVDARVVLMPRLGTTQLHFGGSAHMRKLADSANTVRYRQRPFLRSTNERFIDTGSFSADREDSYGLEAAVIAGPFHAAAEAFWQKVGRPGALSDPTFFGGYAELGYFLTRGDSRGYRDGEFVRVRPKRPIDKGGPGAWQVNLRYDRLDLTDAGITGGRQNGYGVALIWTPTDYTRLMMNYGRMQYAGAVHPAAGGDRSYGVDAFGMRVQFYF